MFGQRRALGAGGSRSLGISACVAFSVAVLTTMVPASASYSTPKTLASGWTHVPTNGSLYYSSWGGAEAYDAHDGYAILAGEGNSSNETWEFSHGKWSELRSAGGPGPYATLAMAYDARDGYVVAFSGCCSTSVHASSTWKFQSGLWTKLNPKTSPPPTLGGAAMTYDAKDRYVLLFGGAVCASATSCVPTLTNSTWKFSNGNWTNITTPVGPTPRFSSSLTYDRGNASAVLFGGALNPRGHHCSGYCPANDTWAFSGGRWTQIATVGAPPARYDGAFAYDPLLNESVLFGGVGLPGGGGSEVNYTWGYVAGTWTNLTSSKAPSSQYMPLIAFDPKVKGLLMFGQHTPWPHATSGTTWEFR